MTTSRAYCSVDGCQNKNPNKHISFFKLPKDQERRNKWLEIIGRPDLMSRTNLKPECHVVCSVHFEPDMIFHTPRLHPDAIPTKYVPTPPSTNKPELETNTLDASTQTDFLQNTIMPIPVPEIKNEPYNTVSVKTEPENTDTPGKRKLQNELKESEQKRKRLETEIQKIEKVQAQNVFP